jgi:phage-related protein
MRRKWMGSSEEVIFRGDSLSALKRFPELARREVGHQLEFVQRGKEPDDWKPMSSVGPGVREIRVRDEHGIFRVLYVTKFDDLIYVLPCFQKKTEKTNAADIELARNRYKEILREQMR